ncbi:lamin tail domain-containing protein [Streptomyces sp. NPDC007088]|uniref:lamin tail domain-containing protein n=1 Tax=Streptomyces sp. NPDC007088 TaxID=3364773 RepID=UPI0036B11663
MATSRTGRRIAATLLVTGSLLGAAALPAVAADHDRGRDQGREHGRDQGRHHGRDHGRDHGRPQAPRSSVVLGPVQYDSPGPDNNSNRSRNAEWVTVKNLGRHPVNLRGWTLTNSDHERYRFGDVRLRGNSSVRVHTGYGKNTWRDLFQGKRDYFWDNRRDTATLSDTRGRVADRESWGRRS